MGRRRKNKIQDPIVNKKYLEGQKDTVKIKKLKVNSEYERLVPPLSKEDYDNLVKSIVKDGVQIPIIVNRKHVILDGHTRYRICQKYKIPFETMIKHFEDPLEEKKFVIESNLHRRSLNKSQKAMLAVSLLEVEEELAKQRQQEAYKYRKDQVSEENKEVQKESVDAFPTFNIPTEKSESIEQEHISSPEGLKEQEDISKQLTEEKGASTYIVAKKLNIGEGTVKRLKEIRDKMGKYPEIKEKFEKLQNNEDEITIGRLYNELKEKEKEELLLYSKINNYIIEGNAIQVIDQMTVNSYDVIIMDPPYTNMIYDYKTFLFLMFPPVMRTISLKGKIFMFIDMKDMEQIRVLLEALGQLKKLYAHNILVFPHKYEKTDVIETQGYDHKYRAILFLTLEENVELTQYYHRKELTDLLTSSDQMEKTPFNILKYIINSATNETDVILNPFAGDGYIAQVCGGLNRKCIAIEKDSEKVKKAINKRNLISLDADKLKSVIVDIAQK